MNPLKQFKIPVFEDLTEDEHDDDDSLDDNEELLDNSDEEIEDTPEDAQEVIKSVGNLIQLPGSGGGSATGLIEVHDDKKGFVKFVDGDKVFYLRKSTILWMLATATTKISTDRLHRFIENREDDVVNEGHIKIGDFIRVKWIDQICICSVLQFKFKKSKYKFMKSYCPIQHRDGPDGGQGVLMLVDFYQVQGDVGGNFLEKSGNFHCYIDIETYVEHIKTVRDITTLKYKIV